MDKKEKLIAGVGIATVLGIAGYEYYKSKKTATTTSTTTTSSSTSTTTQPTKTTTSSSSVTSSTSHSSTTTTTKTSSSSSSTSSSSTSSSSTSSTTSSTIETVTVIVCNLHVNTVVAYVNAQGKWTLFMPPQSWFVQNPNARPSVKLSVAKDTYLIVYNYYPYFTGLSIGVFKADKDGALAVSPIYYLNKPIPGGLNFNLFCYDPHDPWKPIAPPLIPLNTSPVYYSVTINNNYPSSSQQIGVQYIGTDLKVHTVPIASGQSVTINILPATLIYVGLINNPGGENAGQLIGPITTDVTVDIKLHYYGGIPGPKITVSPSTVPSQLAFYPPPPLYFPPPPQK